MKKRIKNIEELLNNLSNEEVLDLFLNLKQPLGYSYEELLQQDQIDEMNPLFTEIEDYFLFSENRPVEYSKWFLIQEWEPKITSKIDFLTNIFEDSGYYYRTDFEVEEIYLWEIDYKNFHIKYSLDLLDLKSNPNHSLTIYNRDFIWLDPITIDILYKYMSRSMKLKSIINSI